MSSMIAAGAHSTARSAWAGKLLELDQRAHDALRVEPGLRLVAIAGCSAGERKPRQAIVEPACQHASDRTETGNGDTGHKTHS